MTLVEKGEINIDDKITKYFPTLRNTGIKSLSVIFQNHVAAPVYLKIFKTFIAFETTPSREEILT